MDKLSREGVAHFNAGRFDEALRSFRAALAGGAPEPDTRCLLAHVHDAAGRPEEAAAEFAAVLARRPVHLPAYAGLSGLVLRRGTPARALTRALKLKPGPGLPRRALIGTLRLCAPALRAAGDPAAAEKALARALALEPANRASRLLLAEALRLRAQAHLAAGRHGPADALVREALALAPREPEARKMRLDALRRRALDRLAAGAHAPAAKRLREALAFEPSDSEARRLLHETLRLRELRDRSAGRRARAAATAAELSRLAPRDARACLGRGTGLFITGAIAEARVQLAKAVRLDRGALAPAERFKALMKLGRHADAVAVAERILDAGPALEDLRAFWDPWEWDERRSRSGRVAELRRLERGLDDATPWRLYYRADLSGPEGLPLFERLAGYSGKRYGWMYFKAACSALLASRFPQAEAWFEAALAYRPVDWRARAFLAEVHLCRRRPELAYAEMERARLAAPPAEAAQVLAWLGAFDLWLGRYTDALPRLEEACRLDAQCAFAWKGAVLLKLGRREEALAQLDLTLERYPLDFEAWLWRGEIKRELGLYKEALKDLAKVPPSVALWARFNRGLAKAALGDRAGLKAEFDAIPARILDYIRLKSGRTGMAEVLVAGLELSRGFRREEYGQAVWLD